MDPQAGVEMFPNEDPPVLVVTVDGLPIPQGSMKHVGNGMIVYVNAAKIKKWRKQLVEAMVAEYRGIPIDWPVRVDVLFRLDPPKQETKLEAVELYRNVGPDLDKLFRCVGDALTDAEVLVDDSRIASLSASRVRSTVAGQPQGATVIVSVL